MKYNKIISILVLCIVLLSLFASLYGLFSKGGPGQYEFSSINGEIVKIYGKGLYKNDSVTVASQGIAQDIVTIILGIPLLLYSLFLSKKGLLKGRLLLTGTLGYYLYTYISYTFLWMYNPLFLVYIILMSSSFYAFILSIMSFDIDNLPSSFSEKLPVKFLGSFLLFFASVIGILWIGMIISSLTKNIIPVGLGHYTTLVIQGMDLGFIVPTAIISAVLLFQRRSMGYLLTSIIIIKGLTMGTALTAMIIGQAYTGVKMGIAEMTIFPFFNLIVIYCLILLLKNIKEPKFSVR